MTKPRKIKLWLGFVGVVVVSIALAMGLLFGPVASIPTSRRAAPPSEFLDWKTLPWGATAFSTPEEMHYDESRVIEVLVSPTHTPAQLENLIAGETRGLYIKVTPLMMASLVGNAFEIEESTPLIQAVAKDEPTRWQWTVKPKKDMYGVQRLTLSLWAKVNIDGTSADRQIKTMNREIRVVITPFERTAGFMGDNWQWFGTALLPFCAWYAKRRWFPDKKEREAHA